MDTSLPASVAELAREGKFLAALQEWAHVDKKALRFDYHREGEDHTPVWVAKLTWRNTPVRASARTKKDAETAVAELIIRGALAPPARASVEDRLAALEREVAMLRQQVAVCSPARAPPVAWQPHQ